MDLKTLVLFTTLKRVTTVVTVAVVSAFKQVFAFYLITFSSQIQIHTVVIEH